MTTKVPYDDPLLQEFEIPATWTTVNVEEALPGVATPLSWTWFSAGEVGLRRGLVDIGALPGSRARPSPGDHMFAMFYGRLTVNLDFMRGLGDAMPGSSGDAVEEQIFGSRRPGVASVTKAAIGWRDVPSMLRLAVRAPAAAWRARRTIRRESVNVGDWWRRSVQPGSTTTMAGAQRLFREALGRWQAIARPHCLVTMVAQNLFDQVQQACGRAGRPGCEFTLIAARADVFEMEVISDLWRTAHGKLSLEEFLTRHGYHGTDEGQLSSRSWREDPRAIQALLESYRQMPAPPGGGSGPLEAAAIFAPLGRVDRLRARVVLKLGRVYVPLREEGRAAFLHAYDVGRAMARRIGDHLVAAGRLDEREDVFYLTVPEVLDIPHGDLRALVAHRRACRDRYLDLELPQVFSGQPVPTRRAAAQTGDDEIVALGVSSGVAEGRAIVVLDASDPGELRAGDILVCRTTDPSWAALFYVVDACVIDVGGAMSHGAIVARELGLPCVINTRNGTERLRTGDRIRVDGDAGTVQILTRGGSAA